VVVCGVRMPEYVNPDGPPAADALERQAAEIERLRALISPRFRRLPVSQDQGANL
jgi:hypothetical protein